MLQLLLQEIRDLQAFKKEMDRHVMRARSSISMIDAETASQYQIPRFLAQTESLLSFQNDYAFRYPPGAERKNIDGRRRCGVEMPGCVPSSHFAHTSDNAMHCETPFHSRGTDFPLLRSCNRGVVIEARRSTQSKPGTHRTDQDSTK
jgi:hypothetical protein